MKIAPVSVVIPTVDRGGLLDKAINSVLSQSLLLKELIIVNNGNQEIQFSDNNLIKVIRTEPYIGSSAARNIGIKESSSKYIAFLDDDDIWDKDFLKNFFDAIEKSMTIFDVYVGSLYRMKDSEKNYFFYKVFPNNPRLQRKVYFSNPGIGGQNFMASKRALNFIGGFDEELIGSEDRDIAARFIEAGFKIASIKTSKAILCDHSGPRRRQDRRLKGLMQFYSRHRLFMTPKEKFLFFFKFLDHVYKITRRKMNL